MYPLQNISITAIHGNGGGGFRFDLARPLFPNNINFYNPSLPGFNCNKTLSKKLTIKEYADWLADYLSDIPRPNILMGHGLGGVFVLEFFAKLFIFNRWRNTSFNCRCKFKQKNIPKINETTQGSIFN
jgi:surfactin synthase thioesterase subunit